MSEFFRRLFVQSRILSLCLSCTALISLASCSSGDQDHAQKRALLTITMQSNLPSWMQVLDGPITARISLVVWAASQDKTMVCAPPWSPNLDTRDEWAQIGCRAKEHVWDVDLAKPWSQTIAFEKGETYDGTIWVWVEIFLTDTHYVDEGFLVYRNLRRLNYDDLKNVTVTFAPKDFCFQQGEALSLRLIPCTTNEEALSARDPAQCLVDKTGWTACDEAGSLPSPVTDPNWCIGGPPEKLGQCGETTDLCGNGRIDPGEACDGTEFPEGKTCRSETGEDTAVGNLTCSADCKSIDHSHCAYCGDNTCAMSYGENPSNCASDCGIISLAAGGEHTCMVTGSGEVWCWGSNKSGQLGIDNQSVMSSIQPRLVEGVPDCRLVVAGDEHSCALTDDGRVFCWGDTSNCQTGTTQNPVPPYEVEELRSCSLLTAGHAHTCALCSNQGSTGIWCWGANDMGQLGNANIRDTSRCTPVKVDLVSQNVTSLSAGGNHTCAVHNRSLDCWGQGESGELGNGLSGTENIIRKPVTVDPVDGGYALVACGGKHTCATTTTSGAAYCWGLGDSGQLGDATDTPHISRNPARLVSDAPKNLTTWSLGALHSCAANGDGLYCWGENSDRQLGIDTSENKFQPTQVQFSVTGTAPVTLLSLGGAHTCAYRDLALWCWGSNSSGQLGLDIEDVEVATQPTRIW